MQSALSISTPDKFYAVAVGRKPGIYKTWTECDKEVKDFKGAKYKKFATYQEANDFIKSVISIPNISNSNSNNDNISQSIPKSIPKPIQNTITRTRTIIPKQKIVSGEYIQNTDVYSPKLHEWNKFDNEYYIFTDGSYKSSTSKSGIGVYITPTGMNIKNLINNPAITNNICELTSILYSFQIIIENLSDIIKSGVNSVTIVSDSEYSIKSITVWSANWKKNNWKTSTGEPVKNRHIIESILQCMDEIRAYNSENNDIKLKLKIKLGNIRSHLPEDKTSDFNNFLWHGNNIADLLAQNII
jgi:ribonuclease HI